MTARRRVDGERTKPERVGVVIETYLRSSGLAPRVTQATVIADWARLVGKQVAAVTEPSRVTANGTLFVAVTSNPWMAELSLLEPQILAAINRDTTRPPVKRIRWETKR